MHLPRSFLNDIPIAGAFVTSMLPGLALKIFLILVPIVITKMNKVILRNALPYHEPVGTGALRDVPAKWFHRIARWRAGCHSCRCRQAGMPPTPHPATPHPNTHPPTHPRAAAHPPALQFAGMVSVTQIDLGLVYRYFIFQVGCCFIGVF